MKKAIEILKKYKWAIIATLILLIVGFTANKIYKQAHEVERLTNIVKYKDSHVIDSLTTMYSERTILEKDVLINQHKKELVVIQKKVSVQAIEIRDLKAELALSIGEYQENKTIENCEVVVKKQNNLIAKQDVTIEDLGAEAEKYSRINYELEQKLSIKDTIITSKINLIRAKEIQIQVLQMDNTVLTKKNKRQKFFRNAAFVISGVIVIYQSLTH